MVTIERMVKVAEKSLDKRAMFESGWYEQRITELEDMLFARDAMSDPPCFVCGYNGPGYFQPETHPCAERHHKLLGKTSR